MLHEMTWSESHSVVSDSLHPHGLYSPWNSPGQNTGVGSLSLLLRIFSTQRSNPGLLHCRWVCFFTSWATREAQEYWSGQPVPFPADLPNSGSAALQADSLPAELWGKPICKICCLTHFLVCLLKSPCRLALILWSRSLQTFLKSHHHNKKIIERQKYYMYIMCIYMLSS